MTEDKVSPGRRLVEAFRAAGYEIQEIKIIPTPESIQRRKEVLDFLAKLKHFQEVSRNSTLHFGVMM